MNVLLLILGAVVVVVASFLVWKLLLRGVKGVSKAVAAGIAEGRAEATEAVTISTDHATNPDLTDELMKATYLLGVSELEREPKIYGYDPDENVFDPSEAEVASGTVSAKTLGKAISKMSPTSPARRVLEEIVEKHVRETVGDKDADDLAEAHKETRVLEILKVGTQVMAEKS